MATVLLVYVQRKWLCFVDLWREKNTALVDAVMRLRSAAAATSSSHTSRHVMSVATADDT